MSDRTILIVIALAGWICAGCPTLDLGEAPPDPGTCRPDPAYFETVIWPEYLAPTDPTLSCVDQAGCHDASNGRSSFRVPTTIPVDFDSNYQVVSRFLNCGSPEASAMLTKPVSGIDSHGGGDIFGPATNSEMVFLRWFAQ